MFLHCISAALKKKKKSFCETLKSNKQSKNTAEGAEDMKGIARILLRSLFSYPS